VGRAIPAIGIWAHPPHSDAHWADFGCRARAPRLAKKILDYAKALEEAGAFMIQLELVANLPVQTVTDAEKLPSKSLGSGLDAHGQLLIYHDAFALYPKFKPRMAKVFADAGSVIRQGLEAYVKEGTEKTFPAPENWFGMTDDEYNELLSML
jgi:3-methyl-2-oxobutanoate hydroxymethyltransferase